MQEPRIMQCRNLPSIEQSNADGKPRRNRAKRQNVLAKKIGAIFSSACGNRSRTQRISFAIAEEKKGPVSEEHGVTLKKTHSSEQIQVARVDSRRTRKGNGKKRRKQLLTSSLSGIFRKSSTGFNLRKWKTIKTSSAKANGAKGPFKKAVRLIRKRDVQQGKKAATRKEEKAHETEEGKIELCKKRILMGEKCRPLNQTGVLHYDKEGILLPEDVLQIEEP